MYPPGVYVACSSLDLVIARRAMHKVTEAGFNLSYDWTTDIESEDKYTEDDIISIARVTVQSIRNSDYVIAIVTDNVSVGMHFEIGMALGCATRIAIVDPHNKLRHFFGHHPLVHYFDNVEEAILNWG